MTAGKNPRNFKKKGQKKKLVHPFIKKEWYNVLAPTLFETNKPTITPCNKTAGQKISADSLRGRVFDISLADLQNEKHEDAWRKIQLQVEEVKGMDCYTNFYGMDVTRDKLCTLVKKWHSLIEAFVQAKTTDGYLLRMFCIAFTRRHKRQVKATCYAKNSQQKLIRQKMMEIMLNEITKNTLQSLFKKLLTDQISKQIQKDCNKIFPLENVLIRKVKVLKKPKFDLTKLMELYTAKVDVPATAKPVGEDATNLLNKQ
jgi:small subunit ribosomal protein S3Ae